MLIDSNIVIYAAEPGYEFLRELIENPNAMVSVVTYVEVLGHLDLQDYQKSFFENFFASASQVTVTMPIVGRAAFLRQQRRMGLGDAIIAATALEHDLALVTRNVRDFRWIGGLSIVNPFET